MKRNAGEPNRLLSCSPVSFQLLMGPRKDRRVKTGERDHHSHFLRALSALCVSNAFPRSTQHYGVNESTVFSDVNFNPEMLINP